jgi:hypothetical protein
MERRFRDKREIASARFSPLPAFGHQDLIQLLPSISVTKCFPGRKRVLRKNKRTVEMLFNEENRVPNSKEIENCRPFLQRQIQYLRPKVIILLGKLAIEA